jgi:GNAT superfamily N-acetyltransferase
MLAHWQFPLHSMRRDFSDAVKESLALRFAVLAELPEHPLRVIEGEGVLRGWAAGFRLLPWDTKFFGFTVGKLEFIISPEQRVDGVLLEAGRVFVRQVIARAQEFGIEHLSVQLDPSDVLTSACLQEEGFRVLDTIVCYRLNLRQLLSSSLKLSEYVREGQVDDIARLEDIAAVCFSQPEYNANRFNADYWVLPAHTEEMYRIWARKSITGERAHKTLVYDSGEGASGFITVQLAGSEDLAAGLNLASIPLNAVAPEMHGKGIYSALVNSALTYLAGTGADWVDIRTQLPNVGVHKVWQRLGATPVITYHTLRFAQGEQG